MRSDGSISRGAASHLRSRHYRELLFAAELVGRVGGGDREHHCWDFPSSFSAFSRHCWCQASTAKIQGPEDRSGGCLSDSLGGPVWDRGYSDSGSGFHNIPLGQEQTISYAAEHGFASAKRKSLDQLENLWSVFSSALRRAALDA